MWVGWLSFEAPGVFHAGPRLFGLAVDQSGAKLAFGQASSGGLVKPFEARAFFNLGLDHLAIHAHQKTQGDRAFFFEAARCAGVFRFFTLADVHASRCAGGRGCCRARGRSSRRCCSGRRRRRGGLGSCGRRDGQACIGRCGCADCGQFDGRGRRCRRCWLQGLRRRRFDNRWRRRWGRSSRRWWRFSRCVREQQRLNHGRHFLHHVACQAHMHSPKQQGMQKKHPSPSRQRALGTGKLERGG